MIISKKYIIAIKGASMKKDLAYISYLIEKYRDYQRKGNTAGCKRVYLKLWKMGIVL